MTIKSQSDEEQEGEGVRVKHQLVATLRICLPSNKLVVRPVMITISQVGSPRTSESLHTVNETPSLKSL